MKYDKKSALSIVFSAAESYEKHLRDKKLLFVFCDKHKNIGYLEVEFNAGNFMHLTGLKSPNYKAKDKEEKTVEEKAKEEKLWALDFYGRCLNKRLKESDFVFAEDGTTPLKLEVLPALITKNLSANMIGDFSGRTVTLYTEKIAGSLKGCMGFVADKEINKLVPNTVLKVDPRHIMSPQNRILLTYRKAKGEADYSEIVYAAKNIDWDSIKFPEAIKELPKPMQDKNNI